MNRERNVGGSADRRILHNHINNDVRCGDIRKNPGSHSRFIAHTCDAEFCLMAVETDPTNQHVFHAGSFFFGDCPAAFRKARSHFEFDAEFFRKFYGTRLHHLGAAARHLEQLIIGNLVEFLGV